MENLRSRLKANASESLPYENAREALAIIKTSTDSTAVEITYRHFSQAPVLDRDDLMSLYNEAKNREENLPLFGKDADYENFGRIAQISSIRLSSCTEVQFQDDIATLLGKEADTRYTAPNGKHTPVTQRGAVKATIRLQRIKALIDAAGNGKNEKARASLWKIVDSSQDSYLGQLAVGALGKIGEPEDLDRLVGMLKKNPNLRISLGNFGTMVVPRLMREIDDPAIPETVKASLTVGLVQASSHDNLSLYIPLLKHPSRFVVSAALDAIGKNIHSDDEGLIRDMFASPARFTRVEAILSVGERAWNEKYIPLLLNALKTDPVPSNRALAAHYLGLRRVQGAVPALTAALKDSPVHGDAETALKRISGELKN